MRSPLAGFAFFLGSDSCRSETHYTLFRTKSNRNDSFCDRVFSKDIRNRVRLHNLQNINPRFLHKTSCICNTYARNYTSFAKELWMGREQSIDGTRRIYISDANYLYMGDRPSVFSLQTVCFSFIRVVCICVLRCQPVKCRYSFASFRSSLQRGGNMAFSLCIKSKVSK